MVPVRESTPPQKLRAVSDTSNSPCAVPATRNRPEWMTLTEEPPGKATLPRRPSTSPDTPRDQPIANMASGEASIPQPTNQAASSGWAKEWSWQELTNLSANAG